MKRWFQEFIIILVAAALIGFTFNLLRPDGLALLSNEWGTRSPSLPDAEVKVLPMKRAIEEYEAGRALFLDSRSQEDYSAGHIRGAINLPDHHFEESIDRVIDQIEQYETLITYCDGEDCALAASLAEKLNQLGFEKVFYIINGWTRWREMGLPVTAEGSETD